MSRPSLKRKLPVTWGRGVGPGGGPEDGLGGHVRHSTIPHHGGGGGRGQPLLEVPREGGDLPGPQTDHHLQETQQAGEEEADAEKDEGRTHHDEVETVVDVPGLDIVVTVALLGPPAVPGPGHPPGLHQLKQVVGEGPGEGRASPHTEGVVSLLQLTHSVQAAVVRRQELGRRHLHQHGPGGGDVLPGHQRQP